MAALGRALQQLLVEPAADGPLLGQLGAGGQDPLEDPIQDDVVAVPVGIVRGLGGGEIRRSFEGLDGLPEGLRHVLAAPTAGQQMARDLAHLRRAEPPEHELLERVGFRMAQAHPAFLRQTPAPISWRVRAARHRVVTLLMLAGL